MKERKAFHFGNGLVGFWEFWLKFWVGGVECFDCADRKCAICFAQDDGVWVGWRRAVVYSANDTPPCPPKAAVEDGAVGVLWDQRVGDSRGAKPRAVMVAMKASWVA